MLLRLQPATPPLRRLLVRRWPQARLAHAAPHAAAPQYAENAYAEAGAGADAGAAPELPILEFDPSLLNFVSLVGNLGADVGLQRVPSGKALAKLRLAVSRGEQPNRVTHWCVPRRRRRRAVLASAEPTAAGTT